jgi:hypothetical protein
VQTIGTNYQTAQIAIGYPSTVQYAYPYTSGTTTVFASPLPETEEQRLERAIALFEYEARRKRARATLLTVLTAAQRKQFKKHEHFDLQVNGRLYRVRPGRRVERLDPKTKKVESRFCIHPASEHNLPDEDVALSQKLFLESNERDFLRLANETRAA